MSSRQELVMPQTAVPIVIAIVAFFAVFMVAIGGVQIWTSLPTAKRPD